MRERFTIRHKIISYLFSKLTYTDTDVPKLQTTISSLAEIAEKTGIPYDQILKYHHGIPKTQAECLHHNNIHSMVLKDEGIDAALEEYWIREGVKQQNESTFDKTKWLVPVLALIATLGTLGFSIYNTVSYQSRVSKLEKEVTELRNVVLFINEK